MIQESKKISQIYKLLSSPLTITFFASMSFYFDELALISFESAKEQAKSEAAFWNSDAVESSNSDRVNDRL